jgi:TonB family protein
MAAFDTSGVEVCMPHLRTAKDSILLVFLASAAFLISGIVTASPSPSAQEGYFNSPLQDGHLIPAPRGQEFPISLEVLSPVSDKVNLSPYLGRLYSSIRRNLLAKLPESALGGEKGVVILRVLVQKDGSLPRGAVEIVSSTGKKDMDVAAQNAIHTAAPFGLLPEVYLGSTLDLQFTFYYKSTPQDPAQKSKVVPVGRI